MKKTVLGRAKLCLWLFGISLGIALAACVGVALFGTNAKYGGAVVCAVIALFSFYCAPIYFNSAKKHKMLASILGAIDNGAVSYAEISMATGLQEDACEKLFESAKAGALITGYDMEIKKSEPKEDATEKEVAEEASELDNESIGETEDMPKEDSEKNEII